MAVKTNKAGPDPAPNSMMLRRTLTLLVVCGIVAFLVMAIRLFQLQIIDHDFYETLAIEQQVRDVIVTARRGTIYDTNGNILAMSASVETIYVSPKEIIMYDLFDPDDPESGGVTAEFIANGLAEILGLDAQSILDKLDDVESWYKVIARKVEPEVADLVRAFKNEYDLKGVKLEEDTKRYYPFSSLAAQVIGFVNMENNGATGIEAVYNDLLAGVNGRVVRAKNAAGTDMLFTSFEDYYDAQDGSDVYISIDSSIQYYLAKHLQQAIMDYDLQNGAGAIAMNVKTGAVLGMVSLGDFDLNNYQDVSEEAKALIDAAENEDEKAQLLYEAQQRQWRNKMISDTYEPGSTFKIVTLAMALNESAVTESDTFFCDGSVAVPGRTPVNCWKDGGHGSQTLAQSLQNSCNVAFVNIGMKVGADSFYDYCEAFGFFNTQVSPDVQLTGKTGIDLIGESGSLWWRESLFKDPDNKTQLAAASFGQTFNITPIQLITAVSACVNGGYLMKPYVVERTVQEDGTVVSKTEPTVVRQVISEQTSAIVCQMLEQVVASGTGRNAAVPGYRIGGKTGTSTNTVMEALTGEKHYIVSFLAVAPMDDPEIAILVLLDSPTNKPNIFISGGQMAAPVAGRIMADVLPYMGFEPQYSVDEEAVRDRSVPNIAGLSVSEAGAKLEANGFTYRVIGSGGYVTSQLPAANSVIAAGSQVIIYCEAAPSEELETMPDLTNLTYSIARQRLGSYALFIRASGPITDPTKIIVTGQNISAGTSVEHGTVIIVTVIDKTDPDER